MAKTYQLSDTASSDLAITDALLAGGDGATGSLSLSASSGGGTASQIFATEPGEPGYSGATPTGTLTVNVNLTSVASGTSYQVILRRITSAGAVATSVSSTFGTATLGTHAVAFTNPALGTWASTDRLRVEVVCRNDNAHGGSKGFTFETDTVNAAVTTQFPAGAVQYTQTVAVSAVLSASAGRHGSYLRGLATTSALAVAVPRRVGKKIPLAGTLTPGIAKARNVALAVTSALSTAVARRASLLRSLSAASVLTPAAPRKTLKTIALVSSLAVSTTRHSLLTLAVSVTAAPALAASKVFLLALSAASSVVAAISESYAAGRVLAVSTTLSASARRMIGRGFSVAITMSVSTRRSISLTRPVALSVSAGVVRAISRAMSVSVSVAPALVDAYAKFVTLAAQSASVASLAAHFVAKGGKRLRRFLLTMLGVD